MKAGRSSLPGISSPRCRQKHRTSEDALAGSWMERVWQKGWPPKSLRHHGRLYAPPGVRGSLTVGVRRESNRFSFPSCRAIPSTMRFSLSGRVGFFLASCTPSRQPGSRAPSPRDPGLHASDQFVRGTRESAFTFGSGRVALSMRPGAAFSSSAPRWHRSIQNLGHAKCLGRTASRVLS